MNRIVLVGESNPYGADPDMALYPLPREASGNRLRVILGLTDNQYLGEHDRVNLCEGRWSVPRATEQALAIHQAREGCGIVLCGVRVVGAFARAATYSVNAFPLCRVVEEGGRWYLAIPHPSGRNRVWNDPEVAPRVRAAYLDLRKHLGMEIPR